ncbi:MAG: GntR family transcriptional regulator [Acidobacteriota bacterium]
MQIQVHSAGELPVYLQIVHQIQQAIAADQLRPGEQLDSYLDLARQTGIEPSTIQQAYDELECLGVIETPWRIR